MRLGPIALSYLLAVVVASPVCAQDDEGEAVKLSPETAMVATWSLARCSVKRDRDTARAVVDSIHRKEDGKLDSDTARKKVQDLLTKNNSCLAPGDTITGSLKTFTAILGGAVFYDKYQNKSLPDYSTTPALYTLESVEKSDSKERASIVFRVFAECVFRLKPTDVKTFIGTRPFSDDENAALGELQPALGICLPAEKGAQMKLRKATVREYLSIAAYLVDQVYEFTKPKQTSEMTREQGRLYA